MVRSRQIIRKLAWWLAMIGYDLHDHSLTHRIFLVYASIFWSVWFLAMFSLFASPATILLNALSVSSLNRAAAILIALGLLAWGLVLLWKAMRRSPIVFSENDAYLICQAPVPPHAVALTWLLGDWFEPAAPFWAGSMILSIALVDFRLGGKVGLAYMPVYIAASLQALLVIILVQFGMMALVWAAGALRLQGERQLSWQPGAIRLVIAAVGLGLTFTLFLHGVVGLDQPFWQAVLWPIILPLNAAFGAAPLIYGLLIGLAWVGLGLAALALSGSNLNLNRAAQETTQKEMVDTAQHYGQVELSQQIALASRLGSGRPPTHLPTRPGYWMLLWKDALQSAQAFRLSELWGWLSLFLVGIGVCFAPEVGLRGLLLAIWAVMVGQRVTARLQKDLAHWSLLRLLPFSSERLLIAELALPWALVVLVGWLTLAIGSGTWEISIRFSAALLLLFLSASVSLAAAFDLLHQSKSDMLLYGTAPQASFISGLLSILCLALPLSVWYGLDHFRLAGSLLAGALGLILSTFFWYLASNQLRDMK